MSILQLDGGANVPVVTKLSGQSASIKKPGRWACAVVFGPPSERRATNCPST